MRLCSRRRSGVFQRGGAFPGHHREGGESQTGGGAQICGAAEETVRVKRSTNLPFCDTPQLISPVTKNAKNPFPLKGGRVIL